MPYGLTVKRPVCVAYLDHAREIELLDLYGD